MNEKFEKWVTTVWRPDDGEELIKKEYPRFAAEAWKAAIQSLEVTPELVAIGIEATSHNSFATTSDIGDALRAVLSALKEQAK